MLPVVPGRKTRCETCQKDCEVRDLCSLSGRLREKVEKSCSGLRNLGTRLSVLFYCHFKVYTPVPVNMLELKLWLI